MISVGDTLPEAVFFAMGDDGPTKLTRDQIFAGKKVAVFGLPGAFTPTCSGNHLPGFIENAEAFKAKGIDSIVCISVNDIFVLDAWDKISGNNGTVLLLGDGAHEFTRAVGLDADMSVAGFGIRSVRYSMLVDNGTVTVLNVEEKPGSAELSGAQHLLEQI